MDLRLKERLVGAAVLVALGVWLIPWVLDGPAEAPEETQAAALDLPAPHNAAPVRSQTIRLDQPTQVSVEPGADAAQAAGHGDGAPAEAASASAEAALAEAAPAKAAREPADAPANAQSRDSERTERTERAAVAPAPPSAPRAAAPDPEPAGAWVVQLGSFGEEANAERLASRVGTYGYRALVSDLRAGGRVMHRVRVGPHATRDEAEAVASSLSAHGFVAQVVTAQ